MSASIDIVSSAGGFGIGPRIDWLPTTTLVLISDVCGGADEVLELFASHLPAFGDALRGRDAELT